MTKKCSDSAVSCDIKLSGLNDTIWSLTHGSVNSTANSYSMVVSLSLFLQNLDPLLKNKLNNESRAQMSFNHEKSVQKFLINLWTDKLKSNIKKNLTRYRAESDFDNTAESDM